MVCKLVESLPPPHGMQDGCPPPQYGMQDGRINPSPNEHGMQEGGTHPSERVYSSREMEFLLLKIH